MQSLEKVLLFLRRDDVVSHSGFALGLGSICLTKDKNNYMVINQPLLTIFWGGLSGMVCSIGADIVGSMLPKPLKPIIPLAVGSSLLYHFYNPLTFNNDKDQFN